MKKARTDCLGRKIGPLLIIALLAFAIGAQAQGTMQFVATLTGTNEVPPNADPTVTTGTFSLTGDSLSFTVNVPAITFIAQNAYIQGPALPGSNGPIIFDLGGPVFHGGSGWGAPPYYAFFSPYSPPFGAGPFTLTGPQIGDLEAGLWYVNVTSGQEPNGQLRGQIAFVPEPAAQALLLLCLGIFLLAERKQSKTSSGQPLLAGPKIS